MLEGSSSEYGGYGLIKDDGSNVWFRNTGTVQKTAGTEFSQVQFQFENEGTVNNGRGARSFFLGVRMVVVGRRVRGKGKGGSFLLIFRSYIWGSGVHVEGPLILAGGDIRGEGYTGRQCASICLAVAASSI